MPELPEVEVLAAHLRPLLAGKRIKHVSVLRPKVLGLTTISQLKEQLEGAVFQGLHRRGKYLVFTLQPKSAGRPFRVVGHLGMTGRMFLLSKIEPLPKHTAVALELGNERFVFQDTRYFGRFTLDACAIQHLGPEPLEESWVAEGFRSALRGSRQPIKTRLLDQRLVAGIGNIYASEALFQARVPPGLAAGRLTRAQGHRLWAAIREVLGEAIRAGSTIPLNFSNMGGTNGLFYFGSGVGKGTYHERLLVYDRAGAPCVACGTPIKRIVQANRSTFYCPRCQGRQAR